MSSPSLSEPRRPRILPQNRKLRHLKGISLRNLSFASPVHLRTADNASASRFSPSRNLESLGETSELQLRKSSPVDELDSALQQKQQHKESTTVDDGLIRPRRTSLNLGGAAMASPSSRQAKLENLIDNAVGDVFFSVHVPGSYPEPVYISEVRERSAHFNFHFFDLSEHNDGISRACAFTIRLWARRPKTTNWVFLVDEIIDLRQLHFIGILHGRQFPPNALVLHLEDGPYSLDFPERIVEPRRSSHTEVSSSYSALMRLANLECSIEDAIATRNEIVEQINQILEDAPTDRSAAIREQVVLTEKHVATQKRTNQAAQRRKDQLLESLRSRGEAMTQGREVQVQAEKDIANNREKLEESRALLEQTEQAIRGQRRRICSELSAMFPIAPISNAPPLSFEICGIPVPNSTYDASTTSKTINEDVLSAGLGLLALLTCHLQLYLSHPLPYPLFFLGSRSMARDEISQLQDMRNPARRDFPLHLPRGGSTSGQWRFEYAWFLLNKDIEALCASQGLRVVDICHSLPNLKYLLYVSSAGTEEVPERRKGGVRGLWQAGLIGKVPDVLVGDAGDRASDVSRRGSVDSEGLNQNGGALEDGTGTLAENSKAHVSGLPFEDAKFTLRTKGLRERVA